MALASRLTDIDQVMVCIAYHAYGCPAAYGNHSHFTGGETEGGIFSFFRHQLCAVACGTYHLAAFSGTQLYIVYLGTYGNRCQRKAVAHFHFRFRPVHDFHAVCEPLGSYDIGFFPVRIADQGNVCASVRVVFNAYYCCGNPILISFKINNPVFSLSAAAAMPNGNFSLVIAPGIFLKGHAERFSGVVFVISEKSEPVICLLEGV